MYQKNIELKKQLKKQGQQITQLNEVNTRLEEERANFSQNPTEEQQFDYTQILLE